MPLSHVYCCKENGENERKCAVPVEECLEHAGSRRNTCSFTYELLKAMFDNVQDRGRRVSTTTLSTACMRSEWYQRLGEYTEQPKKLYASFRGTMFHGQLEGNAHPDSVAEPRYHIDLTDYGLGPFSGSPDLVDVKKGLIYDYKFVKETPKYAYPYAKHVEQAQINRWLVDNAEWVECRDEYGAMQQYRLERPENRARFVPMDWQGLYVVYMDDKGARPLLVTKSERVLGKNGREKSVRVADIWSDERVFDLIRTRFDEVQQAFTSDTPPDLTEEFRGWEHPLCDYCPAKRECVRYEMQEAALSVRSAVDSETSDRPESEAKDER